MTKIIAVGDIMPGGLLNGTDKEFVSPELKALLKEADIRVGTLETAIGNIPSFYTEKMSRRADVIYAMDDDLKRLVDLDINIVSLANNHFYDLGPEGAEHAIELLDQMGIKHCGAGKNHEEASKPVVFEKEGKSYAFLAFCDWREETVGWCPFATATEPGVNPMYDDNVVEQINQCKKQYDYVIVIPHWGKEHTFITTRHVYRLSKKMMDAGADMIFGGHTHRIQPVVTKRNSVIAYSLGNFLFPDRLIVKPRSTYYPEKKIDVSKLPVTDRYPFVEETTLKIWIPMARIGMGIEAEINCGRVNASCFYVRLDYDNKLELYKVPLKIRIPLLWQKFWLSCLPYEGYEYILSKIKYFLKRILSRRRS